MTKDLQRAPEAAPAPAGTSNADKARALIALLESGGGAGAGGIPPARLRDWARDLVETVERARSPAPAAAPVSGAPSGPPSEPASAPAAAAPAAAPAQKQEPRLTASRLAAPRLFTKAPPVLVDRVPPATASVAAPAVAPEQAVAPPPAAPPSAYRPAPVAAPAYAAARAPAARMTPGAPVPHVAPRPQAAAPARAAILPRQEVDRIVVSTLDPAGDPATLGREHPAIVALTLLGRPTLQQAAVLRALPGPQMRAVHRALRLLEARER